MHTVGTFQLDWSVLRPPALNLRTRDAQVALIMLVVMLLQMVAGALPAVPVAAPARQETAPVATSSTSADESPLLAQPYAPPAELGDAAEIAALRTADSATYLLADGSRATMLGSQPMHYQDVNGTWQVINPWFRSAGGKWLNDSNSVRVEADRTLSSARIGGGAAAVAWMPQALEFTAEDGTTLPFAATDLASRRVEAVRSPDGRTLRYTGSWQQNLQDQWQTRPGSAEYTMRLDALPQAPRGTTPETLDLRVQVELAPGTRLMVSGAEPDLPLQTSETLHFVADDGSTLELAVPRAFELSNPEAFAPASWQVSEVVDGDSSVLELRLQTPWAWLAETNRSYPVILDPIFQMRSGTQFWHHRYDRSVANDPGQVFDRTGADFVAAGASYVESTRIIVRFNLPAMPVGTVMDKAMLYLVPNNFGIAAPWRALPQNSMSQPLAVHRVLDSNWQGSGGALNWEANALAPGAQWVSYVGGNDQQSGKQWDITSVAQGWMVSPGTPNVNNHGLLIRSTNENCNPYLIFTSNIHDPLCGTIFFNASPSAWSDWDMANTQQSPDPMAPTLLPSDGGGIRLVVTYHSDNVLDVGEVGGVDAPGGGAPTGDAPYYAADHLYQLPALSDSQWQAVVIRGLGPRQGPNPPQGAGQIYRRFVQGQLNLSFKGANDALEFTSVTPAPNQVGYMLFNGAGSQAQAFNQNTLLRVAGVNGSATGAYDVRLMNQMGSISTVGAGGLPKAQAETIGYLFDSANPLALWNLQLPANANNRITIRITSDYTKNHDFLKLHGSQFNVRIVNSDSQLDLPLSGMNARDSSWGNGADREMGPIPPVQDAASGITEYQSQIFPYSGGKWALAVAYNGPQITSWTVPDCWDENCAPPAQVVPIGYIMQVTVHSCPAGTFPTSGGQCQVVKCPTTATFPAGSPGYQTAGGMALWSQPGWAPAGGTALKAGNDGTQQAPLLGPPALNGVRLAPTVALIGGTVTFDTAPNPDTVSFNNKTDVLLIKCQPPASGVETFEYFQTYRGAMNLSPLLLNPPTFVPGSGARINFVDPFEGVDRAAGDISSESTQLRPVGGTFHGSAGLRRQTGFGGTPATTLFAVQWAVNADGWTSLAANVSLANTDPLERIGGLTVTLGTSFTLDTPDANGALSPRRFQGVRAEQAAVTQDVRLGGASKTIKAVFLPRGVPAPTYPNAVACPRNCLDLRAPTDVYRQPMNRTWEMPDVHTDVQPGTLAFAADGSMIVASVDHPESLQAASVASPEMVNFSESFSFDAYKASVSVTSEPCEPGQPAGLVIRGETRIAMPNLGSTTDPNAGITAGFKLCESPPDGLGLRQVVLSFESPVGIPIGTSGLFLVALGGEVRIRPEGTRVTVNVAFQTEPTGPGEVLWVKGTVVIDTQGLFAFTGEARLLGTVSATGSLWVAWNPLDMGFEVQGGIEDWVYGSVRAHMWRGRGWNNYTWLPDNDDMHFAAAFEATLQIPAGAVVDWGPIVIPPGDISFGVALEFGEFCVNSSCTNYEWGVKGNFEVLGEEIGLYYGFEEGLDFILGSDDHILIDQYGGAQSSPLAMAANVASASALLTTTVVANMEAASDPVKAAGLDVSDMVQVAAAPEAVGGTALIPFTVLPSSEGFLVALGWQAGTPQISLINPDGVEMTPANVGQFQGESFANGEMVMLSISMPKPGAWKAKIANLSTQGIEHYKFVYLSNKGKPGTPGNRGAIQLPAVQNETPVGGQYTIKWQVPADTPTGATVSLYLRRTTVITGNIGIDVPLVRNLPAVQGQFVWDTARMLNGAYQVKLVMDDGVNDLPAGKVSMPVDECVAMTTSLPRVRTFDPKRFPGVVTLMSPGTVLVNDTSTPDVPQGLQAYPQDGAIMVRWNAPAAPDVATYQLRWGPKNPGNPQGYIQTAQTLLTAGGERAYRIGAVTNNIEYGITIVAIDANDNKSATSGAVFAKPGAGGNPVPTMPENLQRTARTGSSASFTWTPGPGAAPAGYRIFTTRLSDGSTAQMDAASAPATVSSLTAGEVYEMRVAAFNSDGWLSALTPAHRVLITAATDGNGDGLYDDYAARFGLTSAAADPDSDGLTSGVEQELGTNPTLQDSDGDELTDGEEVNSGTDPLNAQSVGSFTQPRLRVAEDKLRFRAKLQAGGQPAPQLVEWVNAGGGSVNAVATSASAWLLPAVQGNMVQVSLNTAGLAPGFYSGVVRVAAGPGSSAPAVGKPACIRVNAWVLPADTDIPSKLGQAIDFPPQSDRVLGEAPFTVAAASSSGLPVSFTSSTPAVCTVVPVAAGATVTLLASGPCTLNAQQAGNVAYAPAAVVSRSFQVLNPATELPLKVWLPVAHK